MCESPIALKEADCEELYSIAEEHGLVLMDAIKTAYSTAYERLVLLAKSGKLVRLYRLMLFVLACEMVFQLPEQI